MFLASSRLISEGEVTAQEVSRAVNRWDYHCIPARDGRDICDAGNDECAHGAAGRFVPLTALVDGPHEWHSAQRPAESLPTVVGAFRFCCERVEPLARPRLNSSLQPAEQLSCQAIGETSEGPVHLHYRLPGTGARRRVILEGAASASFVRSEEHTSELQSQSNLVCRLLLEKKKNDSSSFVRSEEHTS